MFGSGHSAGGAWLVYQLRHHGAARRLGRQGGDLPHQETGLVVW